MILQFPSTSTQDDDSCYADLEGSVEGQEQEELDLKRWDVVTRRLCFIPFIIVSVRNVALFRQY